MRGVSRRTAEMYIQVRGALTGLQSITDDDIAPAGKRFDEGRFPRPRDTHERNDYIFCRRSWQTRYCR